MQAWLVRECWSGVQNWMWALALASALYLAVLALFRTHFTRAE